MTLAPFEMRSEHFSALACSGGDVETMGALVAARRSRTIQLLTLIARHDSFAAEAFQALCDLDLVVPEAVRRVLDDPSVGMWATHTASRSLLGLPGTHSDSARLAFVAAAAALRGGVPVRIILPPSEYGWLPSVGVVVEPLGGGIAVVDGLVAGRAVVPLPRIDMAGFSVHVESWFGKRAPAGLTPCAIEDFSQWRDRMSSAWQLLRSNHAGIGDALAATVTAVSPLSPSATGSSSATVADAFGCIFLSLPRDVLSLALTFAHELQHTKLVALMDLFPLVRPGCDLSFYAPWRPDPRPLIGLLHGAYAHLGVAEFWRRQRHDEVGTRALEANVQFARWREAARRASETMLACGWLTPVGQSFVSHMLEVLRRSCDDAVPNSAMEIAADITVEHQRQWIARNGPLPRLQQIS